MPDDAQDDLHDDEAAELSVLLTHVGGHAMLTVTAGTALMWHLAADGPLAEATGGPAGPRHPLAAGRPVVTTSSSDSLDRWEAELAADRVAADQGAHRAHTVTCVKELLARIDETLQDTSPDGSFELGETATVRVDDDVPALLLQWLNRQYVRFRTVADPSASEQVGAAQSAGVFLGTDEAEPIEVTDEGQALLLAVAMTLAQSVDALANQLYR